MYKNVLVLLFFTAVVYSCKKAENTVFKSVDLKVSGVHFNNKIEEDNIHNLIDYFYVYNGGGVAAGDINGDGKPDLYFTGNQVSDKLYINKTDANGSIQFEEITNSSGIKAGGWSTGVTMVDINADGLLDIYVCKSGNFQPAQRANQLYINEGNNHFKEAAAEYGIADTTYSTQSAFFDYDKDGDLDMFLITSSNLKTPNKLVPPLADGTGLGTDKLYQNDGKGHFVDVSKKAGVLHDGMSLGLSVADFNNDGWEDIFVGNDFLSSDLLYLNNQNGTFTEASKQAMAHNSQFTMGSDAADINNDGFADLISLDMLPSNNEQWKKMSGPSNSTYYEQTLNLGYPPQFMRNMLFINRGTTLEKGAKIPMPHFSEIGRIKGVHNTDWSWGPLLADFDNDGNKDIFITNGYYHDVTNLDFVTNIQNSLQSGNSSKDVNDFIRNDAKKMATLKETNRFFKNDGDLNFDDFTDNWLGKTPTLSNGAAYADLDNDGDLDLVVNNINEPASILQNTLQNTHFLDVILRGGGQNTLGIGAIVKIYCKGQLQINALSLTRGYQSSSAEVVHFGIKDNAVIDSLEVTWADFKTQKLYNVQGNQRVELKYNDASPVVPAKNQENCCFFNDISDEWKQWYTHVEPAYPDFMQEKLLPHKLSQQGPQITKGDINGDGLEDFFIGGAYKQIGKFLIQKPDGTFYSKMLGGANPDKLEEDIGVLLFDADKDNDLDLYIVSGSNENYDNSPFYQDRLYLNDGKGDFKKDPSILTSILHSGSCVAAADFDNDGDLDLFRGGRLTPLEFGRAGESYLLLNDKGKFRDATDVKAAQLRSIGMVTDAVWVDLDKDSWLDLVVVGEYMPITIFKNDKGKLKLTPSLDKTNGFWECIKAADFDNDGDLDLVAGNKSGNSLYRTSVQAPFTLYAGDFDANQSWESITSYYSQGKEYATHTRDDLSSQMPSIKKKFNTYAQYAKAGLNDILSKEQISKALVLKAYCSESVFIENQGNYTYVVKPLPDVAQWSTIKDMLIQDINGDGYLDILAVGNDYGIERIDGQYDASFGVMMLGNGKGDFKYIPNNLTGLWVFGDCRSIVSLINVKKQSITVIGRNNAACQVFKNKTAPPQYFGK